VFGVEAYPFQQFVLKHLMLMLPSSAACRQVFLCQPTGGGKNAVRDAFAACQPGVTLNIAPLLSLNADQSTKLDLRRISEKVVAIHWDQYRQAADLAALEADILSASRTVSSVLFSSPQLIPDNPARHTFLKTLVAKGLLNCMCIDEAHLVVEFGLYFRPEFVKLKLVLFRSLLVSETSNKVPAQSSS
jgi:ATP-dependent DNA helicase RecQ